MSVKISLQIFMTCYILLRNLAKDAFFRYVLYFEGLYNKKENMKKEKDGKFLRTPDGMPVSPNFPGYNEEYYRSIVRDAGERLRVVAPEQ